jgi:hypothetical protein
VEIDLWIKVDILQVDSDSGKVLIRTCEGQLLPDSTPVLYEWIYYESEFIRPLPPTPEDTERKRLDDEFRESILNQYNMSIENCNKDGNCMFRAFASVVLGTQSRHGEIRKLCYDYMDEHRDLFSPFLTVDIANYISDQRQLGKWGDELEIKALCLALKVNVIIYKKGSSPTTIIEIPHILDPGLRTIRLSYHGGIHYNLLHQPEAPQTSSSPSVPALTLMVNQDALQQPPTPVPSTLPPSYQYMPHLWRTLPESAKRSWNVSALLILQQAVKAHRANQPTNRDAAFLKFIHLPRTALNKINKERFKSRRLRKQLNQQQKEFRESLHNQGVPSEAIENQPAEQYNEDMYQAFQPSPFDDPTEDTKTRIIRKASRQVREGYISKAVNTLKSDKVATMDDETIEILKSLHPASTGSLPTIVSPDCTKISISGDDLRSLPDTFFDNGSAPGPSGWTGALITPLLRYAQTANALALLFTLIINGEISDGPLRDCLLAARLIPMIKPNTVKGIRPLAVGEVITRIAANLVLRNSNCHTLFPSIQLGMKVSGGPERAIHTIQSLLESQPTDDNSTIILISTDIKNAYNTCSRTRILSALQHNPAAAPLIPLFHWSHHSTSHLLVYDHHIQTGTTLSHVLESQEGVRQGDPLAGISYDICVQPDYEWVQSQVPTVKLIAIHDDLNIVGPQTDAFKAFDLFKQRLSERGDLKLQPAKCRVLVPILQHATTYQHFEIQEQAEDRQMQVIYGSMPILGGCVGIDDQVKSDFVKSNISSCQQLLKSIENKFMPSQISYLILKMCINTKINYLARITRPHVANEHFRIFDQAVIKTIQHKMELPHETSLSEFSVELFRLPTHLGGYGIPSALEVSPIAYFSSVVACLPYLLPLPFDGSTLMALKKCHTALLTANTGIVPSDRIPTDFVTMLSTYSSIDSASKSRQIQHYITEQVNQFAYTNLLNRSTPIQRAMLGSASAPSAGLAFTVLPTCSEFSFTSPYFNQITRLRLGLTHYYEHTNNETDEQNDFNHRDQQGEILRHNLIAHSIIRIAQDAGYETSREVNLQDDAGAGHRVDAVLYSQYASRPPIMVDVSVTDPCSASHIRTASTKSLASASLREKEKEKEYSKVVKENHGIFYPLILEKHGGFGNKLTRFLKMLQTDATDHHQLSERESQEWLHKAKCSIAAALQVGNGMILNRAMRKAFSKRKRPQTELEELLLGNEYVNINDLAEEQRHGLASNADGT